MHKTAFISLLAACLVNSWLFIPHSRAEEAQKDTPAENTAESKIEQSTIHGEFKDLYRSPVPLKFTSTIDGTTLIAKNGSIYQLPNIYIPNDNAEIAEQAQKKLESLIKDQKCTAYLTKNKEEGRINRMGHNFARLECGTNKIWVGGELIANGLAIVWPTLGTPETMDELLDLEADARKNKKGLWDCKSSYKCIEIYRPETIKTHLNSRAIVEGTVYNTALIKNNILINFEPDWKQDFTIAVSSKLRREFSRMNINLQSLKGKTVLVRGWVRNYNGPMIELDTPDQLQILKNAPAMSGPSAPDTPDEPAQPDQPQKPSAQMHSIKNPVPPSIEKPNPPTVKEHQEKSNGKT